MKGSDRYRVNGVSCRVGSRELPVINMSVGGLFLADDGVLPSLGQDIPLELLLPGLAPLRMTGRVSWHNERERPRMASLPPGFGAKLIRAGFSEKMALLHYLRDISPTALRKR